MRKIMLVFTFFIIPIVSTYSIDEYRIGETIKIYDANLKELQSRITYYPTSFYSTKNVIFLYFFEYMSYALVFDSDLRKEFIEILDKCIEWTNIAKDNNIHKLSRLVKERIGIPFVIPGVSRYLDALFLYFTFSIQEINGKEEIMLIINYKTIDQDNNGRQGSYIVIKQNDFNRLKEIFSADYLTQFDRKAEDQLKTEELFH
jgi:hypothetical protein